MSKCPLTDCQYFKLAASGKDTECTYCCENVDNKGELYSAYRPVRYFDDGDAVNHPSHYGGKIECKDAIKEATKNYSGWSAKCAGDIIKYIWRAHRKNGLEDLRKAQWYMNELVREEEAKMAK